MSKIYTEEEVNKIVSTSVDGRYSFCKSLVDNQCAGRYESEEYKEGYNDCLYDVLNALVEEQSRANAGEYDPEEGI